MKVKVIKKDHKDTRIRPEVMRKMLLDEKSRHLHRVKEIDKRLQTLRTVEA